MSYFLGLDFSTQKLKAVVTDEELKIIHKLEVDYDTQLPEFRTQGGIVRGENRTVTAPVFLWIKALDLLLDLMKLNGIDMSRIKALSGAAQQHGSVFWQKNAKKKLQNLDSSQFLFQQLQGCFSLKESPVWMDSSTSDYCKLIEKALNGPKKLAEITGSRAFERFTGPQIAKVCHQRPEIYEMTERISLVSSFACSLFVGDYADVDYADASGTNLMNIKTKDWDEMCLEALRAPFIREKLGKPLPPHSSLGKIAPYFVNRFGFAPDCQVISFTGDNPATLAGINLSKNDLLVSLGTSDTLMMTLPEPQVFLNGHIMCSAIEKNEWMGLLCFKNGSLTRQRLRDSLANRSWDEFNELLEATPRGNFGNMAFYLDEPEILPFVKKGDYRWDSEGRKLAKFRAPEIEARALIEGQFLSRRCFAEEMGFFAKNDSRIIATGGAASNSAILQVLCDVFNAPVYVQNFSHSAAVGASYLALLGTGGAAKKLLNAKLVCMPNKDAAQIYNAMLDKCKTHIGELVATQL